MPEASPSDLRREFVDRDDLIAHLRERFPESSTIDASVSPTRGGRSAALEALDRIDPAEYARTRNALDGAVTGLSPYIRHGVLTLAEVRDAAIRRASRPADTHKLVNELAWRDYFRRVYRQIGEGVWDDREPPKVRARGGPKAGELPADIRGGSTGLACIDAFARDLRETGYLHNHARMWTAAYVVHWRNVAWQAGARWFLEHLLDGDPASNNLSWQWVASTFSHKPYIFNRSNLDKFTGGVYCRRCPLKGRCDFEGSYEEIGDRLFAGSPDEGRGGTSHVPARKLRDPGDESRPSRRGRRGEGPAVVWLHEDDLNPVGPALSAEPDAPAVWVWDDDRVKDWSLKRLVFLAECLLETPAEFRRGEPSAEIAAFASMRGARRVVTTESPDPAFRRTLRRLERSIPVEVVPPEPFVELPRPADLARFSRYWRVAERALLGRKP